MPRGHEIQCQNRSSSGNSPLIEIRQQQHPPLNLTHRYDKFAEGREFSLSPKYEEAVAIGTRERALKEFMYETQKGDGKYTKSFKMDTSSSSKSATANSFIQKGPFLRGGGWLVWLQGDGSSRL